MSRKTNTEALANELKISEVRLLQKRINSNSQAIDDIVNKLVQEHCKPLDNYVKFIQKLLQSENPPTSLELDDFILNLSTLLYFAGEAQESLGIKEDVAKAVKMELYNEIYDKSDGTIADKSAKADLATQTELITQIVYQRAYKKVKLRMEAGNELLQSIKKVISRRMSEYELSKIAGGR